MIYLMDQADYSNYFLESVAKYNDDFADVFSIYLKKLVTKPSSKVEKAVSNAVKKTDDLADEVVDGAELVRMRLKRDAVKSEARKFNMLAGREQAADSVQSSRILAVDRDLQAVILPVGSVHGAFNGLIFNVSGKETNRLKTLTKNIL